MKKAIVTGANGFVGSALVRQLLANQVEVVALDREGCCQNLPEGVTFLPCELSEIASLAHSPEAAGADVFYHFAWAGSAHSASAAERTVDGGQPAHGETAGMPEVCLRRQHYGARNHCRRFCSGQ